MNNLSQLKAILPTDEFSQIEAIKKEIEDAWHKKQIFRTETEARYAVLNDLKFPTKASKYWQAVREQMVHFEELVRLSFEMQRKKLDIEDIEESIDATADKKSTAYRRLLIDQDEAYYTLRSMELIAKDRVREVMQWSQIKHEVNDGSFDDKNVNTHQKETLFKSVLNRAHNSDPSQLSSEERLSIQGILHMLKDEPVNKKLISELEKKVNEAE